MATVETRTTRLVRPDTSKHLGTQDAGLQVCDLRKSFTAPNGELVEVLRGVDFMMRAGEMIAITGASGSGKSTLLQLLGGLEAADHGSILLNRFPITEAGDPALTRFRQRSIGFVFQFHHLLPDLTVQENVALPLRIARALGHETRSRVERALDQLDLRNRANFPIAHLSGGEQQRVAVARALVPEPALVLADEPTGNLDPKMGATVVEALFDYCRRNGSMVIIATHNPAAAEICDRILRIQEGRLIQT